MKKIITLALVSAMALSVSATVFATNITPQTSDWCNTNITYSVAPTYTVTIPDTVTLGTSADVSANNVVVAKGSKVVVKLTGTSGTNNAFTVKNTEGEELAYTVKNGTNNVNVGDTVLTVNPESATTGSATLDFNAPDANSIKYSGTYSGTVTFTVSIEN
ncbi:MAG: hypothetical protein PUG48_02760 [Clostridia bacterium]|nr:hypothetical protein [Clostridia bacterium]